MADESNDAMMPESCTTKNRSDDAWKNILDNVMVLEEEICIVGQYLQIELSHSAAFIALLKDILGDEARSLVTILQPAVDERLPVILFNLYNARRQVEHIRQLMQSYPEQVAFQTLPRPLTVDFTSQDNITFNDSVHSEDDNGLDMTASGEQLD